MAGQTPIWKKEIRLRSKPPKAAAEAPVDAHKQESASIWKKDLTLRSGKSKEKQPVETAATSEIEAAPGHGSIWKRELRIRRSVPKSRPSSEIDSILAPAVEVEPMPLDLGSRESDDTSAETNDEVSSPAQPKAFVLVERADAAEEMPHSWWRVRWRRASRRRHRGRADDRNGRAGAGFAGTPAREPLRAIAILLPKSLRSTRTFSYGASVALSPFASPAEEDAPLDDEVRGAQPDWAWGSTSAADEHRHPDANVTDAAAGAADSAPYAVEAPWFGSEEEPRGTGEVCTPCGRDLCARDREERSRRPATSTRTSSTPTLGVSRALVERRDTRALRSRRL